MGEVGFAGDTGDITSALSLPLKCFIYLCRFSGGIELSSERTPVLFVAMLMADAPDTAETADIGI